MTSLRTLPEAIAAAAAQLEGIGNSMAAESAAAASPTTAIAPAGADEVSSLQAIAFSTWGQLVQTVNADLQAIHHQFTSLLGTTATSYSTTESANQVAAGAQSLSGVSSLAGSTAQSTNPIEWLATQINNFTNWFSGTPLNSNMVNLGNVQVGNWASAYSDMIGVGGGGLLTALPASTASSTLGAGADLASATGPAPAVAPGAAAAGGAPAVLANFGQSPAVGQLSVPPSWAGGGVGTPSATPATLAGWTAPAPQAGGGVNAVPAGMPGAVASSGRGGTSYGTPRYGLKPKVMPKPTVT